MVKYLTKRGGGASSEDKISPKKASKSATNCKTYSAVKQGYTRPKQCEFGAQNVQKNNAKNAVFESEKQRYKDCKVKSPNAYACKSDSSSKVKYLSKQKRNKLFVVGLFFFAFVFCVSAMFIAPNKMTPQTTTPTPVNAEDITGDCGTNATYKLDSEGTLTISGSGAMNDYSSEQSPFYNNSTILNVVITSEVTSIGNYAFQGCNNLNSITIPNSVTSIGSSAFYRCSSLTSITIPDKVTSIGNYAFNGCSGLTSITIPDSVTSIGSGAFQDCSGLTSITIPANVTTIGYSVFAACSGLTSIAIPDGVTSIGISAFHKCSKLTSITIPNSVTSIGSSAFYYCSGLTSITIPDSVTSIGSSAFYYCSGLTSITIPDSVTSIGERAFEACSKLEKVSYTGTIEGWCNIYFTNARSNPLYYAHKLCIGNEDELVTELNIPNTVKQIKNYVFSGCSGLTSVTIPDSVTRIGEDAFSGCSGLTNITIPDSVTRIGDYAFQNCSSLTSITIPDGVTSIGLATFQGCNNLNSITIPDSVTSIGNYAFNGCSKLTSITIPDEVTSIGNHAFYYCSSLTSITIPNSVKYIDYYAFGGCRSLTSITIPDSVTYIGGDAFYSCSSLTSITIPNSVTRIDDQVFYNCYSLTSITIPNSVKSIGSSAFFNCGRLTSITIPDSVTSIGSSAFSSCSADLIICGSGNKESAAYKYAQSNQINYATAWVTNATTHTRSFYGFKTNSNAIEEIQTGNHNFGADGMAETCSVCGAKNVNVLITLNVTTNVSRHFVIYVLDSDNQPTRQFVVTNGDKIAFFVEKSSTFTIQVYETLYMRAKIGDVDTLKQKYENLTEHKTIAIDISGVTNVYNWVMI